MHISARKERFNVAYLGAIAAQAGVNSAEPAVDNDSIDVMLTGKGFAGLICDPQINLQLKCTHVDHSVGENIRYPLGRKNYDDLRNDRVGVPRYLAVLVVPEICDEWSEHLDDGTLLKSKCYWVSLKGLPDRQQETISVSVPLSQRLTSASLANLLRCASELVDP